MNQWRKKTPQNPATRHMAELHRPILFQSEEKRCLFVSEYRRVFPNGFKLD